MEISTALSLGSLALGGADMPVPDPQPQGLEPLANVLDAPQIVILGASIMEGAFDTGGTVHPHIAAWAAAMGITGTLTSYAVAGHTIAGTQGQLALAKSDLMASEGQNLYVVHTGGNNVSANRPYPGGSSGFEADYDALITAAQQGGDRIIPLPLTFRHYGNTVTPGVNEEDGSAPYNDQILLPRIGTHAPDWMGAGRPHIDPYGFAKANPDLINSDGIHGYGHTIAQYILSRLIGRALGRTQGDSRAGSGLIFDLKSGVPQNYLPGAVNRIKAYPNAAGYPVSIGAVRDSGADVDPFVQLDYGGFTNGNSEGAGAGAFARVPDSRFHDAALLGGSIYVQGTDVFTLRLRNLPVGDAVTVTAVASRNTTAVNRKGLLSLTGGESLVLDAATSAVSNQVVFAPVVVPADGELALSLSVDAGSGYGYLSGVGVDFG
ncbi:hypothetical protein SAMN05421762_3861 [Pseudooceanicola nitratireducens]|uniref:Uncharacterized protein n=1 Tax=Pseudooceanicola nitratireducens TaxID=517719 RepID=A0A1I1R0B6_9RHOB|nr:SGNH/GDSL hydrolase family protein [Pseudooceanicola nitratireducens]SEJ81691.1 hypothetical protein SAMN05216183_1176 [Pseudooceanicola nitratireducens]SFD27755.1 hypothetical protein SAMN05421762_3861 [Pseudooceanicola nitratireducens]